MNTFITTAAKILLTSTFVLIPTATFAASALPPMESGDDGATVGITIDTLPPMNSGDDGATVGTDTDTLPPMNGGDDGATTGPVDTTSTINGSGAGGTFSTGGTSGTTTDTTTATTPSAPGNTLVLPVKLNCPFLSAYVIPGRVNFLTDVAKVQLFMNTYTGTHIAVNGVLGSDTVDAIKAFQTAHLSEVMGPWGATAATGQVYITTLKMINDIACGNTSSLTPDELAIINAYKAGIQNGTISGNTGTTPIVVPTGSSTNPVIPTSSTTPSILNTNASLVGNAFSAVGGFFKSVFHKIGSWF